VLFWLKTNRDWLPQDMRARLASVEDRLGLDGGTGARVVSEQPRLRTGAGAGAGAGDIAMTPLAGAGADYSPSSANGTVRSL
jgi:hypothetical protein